MKALWKIYNTNWYIKSSNGKLDFTGFSYLGIPTTQDMIKSLWIRRQKNKPNLCPIKSTDTAKAFSNNPERLAHFCAHDLDSVKTTLRSTQCPMAEKSQRETEACLRSWSGKGRAEMQFWGPTCFLCSISLQLSNPA